MSPWPALALVSCAASAGTGPTAVEPSPPPLRRPGAPTAVAKQPLDVQITPKVQGGSLEVAIAVVGRGHREGESFEDISRWAVEVRDAGGSELSRIMTGPSRVEYAPVGVEDGTQYDVTVTHSVFFRLPEHVDHVAVRVQVDGAPPVEIRSLLR